MSLSKIDSDVLITGLLYPAGGLTVPASAIADSQVAAAANISALKLEHLRNIDLALTDHATNAAAVRKVIYGAENPGAIDKFEAFVTVAAGATTTITVDLYKNGSSVLSSAISFTSSLTAYTKSAGTVSSATFTDDDVFEVVVTVTGSNPPKGLNARLVLRERGY